MTENAQNPAATNTSNADMYYGDYLPIWRAASHIQLVVTNLPLSTYTDDIQKMLQSIQGCCSQVLSTLTIYGNGDLSISDAIKLVAPCAQQLNASPDQTTALFGGFIIACNKDIASKSGA